MDSTHLHLILNHFPIIGTILATGIMAYGYFTQSDTTKKAALMTWVAMALIAIPVFLTGEPAEERIEDIAGVSKALIEQHEDAATIALWVMEALGLLSLAALVISPKIENSKKVLSGAAFALSLATFGLMAYTGYLGGQIRHTEIRSNAVVQSQMEAGGEQDDDE